MSRHDRAGSSFCGWPPDGPTGERKERGVSEETMPEIQPATKSELAAMSARLTQEINRLRASLTGPAADIVKILGAAGEFTRIEITSPLVGNNSYSSTTSGQWSVTIWRGGKDQAAL